MRALKPVLAATAMAALIGCAPNPIIARDPIPPPDPRLAYACSSHEILLTKFYLSNCKPAPPPATVVVRAKG